MLLWVIGVLTGWILRSCFPCECEDVESADA